ncbi:hypothetical protein WJX74_005782 [Apatococcus lobatus]|uniref:Uncharacterized protein n=1 Tax=Apatococcus lobatus TaxID=904363 RepID=A0AAW1RXG2_9CHLO
MDPSGSKRARATAHGGVLFEADSLGHESPFQIEVKRDPDAQSLDPSQEKVALALCRQEDELQAGQNLTNRPAAPEHAMLSNEVEDMPLLPDQLPKIGAPLKLQKSVPKMRPNELIAEDMQKFIAANGAVLKGSLRVHQVRRVSECATAGIIDVYYYVKHDLTGAETRWRSKRGLVRCLLGLGPQDCIPTDMRSPAQQERKTPKKVRQTPHPKCTPPRTPASREKRPRDTAVAPSDMILDHMPVAVVCGDKAGILNLQTNQVCCDCQACQLLPDDQQSQSANLFQKHAGRAAAHNWRISVRVVESLPEGDRGVSVLKWAIQNNVYLVGSRSPVKRLHLSDAAAQDADAQAAAGLGEPPSNDLALALHSDVREAFPATEAKMEQPCEQLQPNLPWSSNGDGSDVGISHEDHHPPQPGLSSPGSSELRAGSCEEGATGSEHMQQEGHAPEEIEQCRSGFEDNLPQDMRTIGRNHEDIRVPGGESMALEDMDRDGNEQEGQDVSSHPQNMLAAPTRIGSPSVLPRQPLHARTSASGMLLSSRKLLREEHQLPCAAASPVASGSHFSGSHMSSGKQQPLVDRQTHDLKLAQEAQEHLNEQLDNEREINILLQRRVAKLEEEATAHDMIQGDLAREAASLRAQLAAAADASKLQDQELQQLREAVSTYQQAPASAASQGPNAELTEEMQRQQLEIEILSARLEEAQGQLDTLRTRETSLGGSLRAKTADLSFKDDIIAERDQQIGSLERQLVQLRVKAARHLPKTPGTASAAPSCFSGQ